MLGNWCLHCMSFLKRNFFLERQIITLILWGTAWSSSVVCILANFGGDCVVPCIEFHIIDLATPYRSCRLIFGKTITSIQRGV